MGENHRVWNTFIGYTDIELLVRYLRHNRLCDGKSQSNANDQHRWTKRPSALQDPILLAQVKE